MDNIKNELRMKSRGEDKVWKTIRAKGGGQKRMVSTQIGQQVLLADAINMLDDIREWVHTGSGKSYRKELEDYFVDDELLLQKITETLLLLVGSTKIESTKKNRGGRKRPARHRHIKTIREKVIPELSFDQVWRFVEVVISFSEFFDVVKEIDVSGSTPSWSVHYECKLSEVISNKLMIEAHSAFFPEPMTDVPVKWEYIEDGSGDGQIVGGYITYQYEMIRLRGTKIDYRKYSDKIFDAINYIQSVPWKINKAVVEKVKEDTVEPKKEDFVKTPFPNDEGTFWGTNLDEDNDFSDEEIKEIEKRRESYKEQAEIYKAEMRDFESAIGKFRAIKLALGIVDKYDDSQIIYFPHSYDFRGRIYPIPVGLSPQGSDAVKAMLEYAHGEVLTKDGENWMWAYLASLYGDDKIPFSDRIERGKELINVNYKEADEPYQFLSHQLEIKKWLKDKNYKVKARIHLDACNSGSQFTSSITCDRTGCIATNVIPTIEDGGFQPRFDAYELVANKALDIVENKLGNKDEKYDVYTFLKNLLTEHGRKVCKRPVMVSNYGGTAGGRAEILWDMFRELGVDRKWITKKNAIELAKIIGDSIVGVLMGGKAFEKYIQNMNNVLAKRNKPVTWVTGDGFFVVHKKNKELKRKQVTCIIPGARKKTSIYKKSYSDELSAPKMRSAISPNYIHSLDAELLRRVALRMKSAGIKYSDFIHDSFGCLPNHVNTMLMITKYEFSDLIKKKPLEKLDAELRRQAGTTKNVQKQLAKIVLPNLEGFNVENGDLDVVFKSDWFFS